MSYFINGAEAIGMAAVHAGCDFFAGYPITPATPILLEMIEQLPEYGGLAIQAEDEIAALGFCIGAALTGARVFTATSGPGMSLFSENLGLAIMCEVPVVIVDCQRMGPATGGATSSAQGDIQFLQWGTSGGYPLIVLSPTDAKDCFNHTLRAFDLAERFRSPVIVATDKETILTRTTVPREALKYIEVRERQSAPNQKKYLPYEIEDPSDVPDFSPFGGEYLMRATTSSHDEAGYLTKDKEKVKHLNEHLSAKIFKHVDEISDVDVDLQEDAKILLVSYGISARSMNEAVKIARRNGIQISSMTILSLWPVPRKIIKKTISDVNKIIVIEMNQGQYLRELERLVRNEHELIGVGRVDGELITPQEILIRGGSCEFQDMVQLSQC